MDIPDVESSARRTIDVLERVARLYTLNAVDEIYSLISESRKRKDIIPEFIESVEQIIDEGNNPLNSIKGNIKDLKQSLEI